jgi:hypothetical protein
MNGCHQAQFGQAGRWIVKACIALVIATPQLSLAQSTSQQMIVPGTAVPRGSGSKAMQAAEAEAKLAAAKFAWTRLRGRGDFATASARFTPDQNAGMAQAMVELCNFTKLDETKDKSTKSVTMRFSLDCPTQDLLSRAADLRGAVEAEAANSLDSKPHDQLVYLFMSRRIADMTSSSSDGATYRASQKRFELVSSQALEDGLVNRINSVGLNAVSYADVVASGCATIDNAAINREFSITPPGQSDYGLTTDTRAEVIKSLRTCGIKYFALGAADVGVTGRDTITGQPQGRVVVSAQVLDIQQGLPVTLARVRTTSDETGNDEVSAEENAMAKAASDVGLKLVEQIKVRGIR